MVLAPCRGIHKGVCTQLAKYIRELRQVYMLDIMIMARDNTRDINSFQASRRVFVVHCVCPDAINGTGSCAKVIPNNVIDLMIMLYEYFARSPPSQKEIYTRIHCCGERSK